MKFLSATCLASLGLFAATPIWAEATEAGAAELLSVFQTYLGSADGVVSVAVAGDAYAVTVDPAPLMAIVPVPGMSSSITPILMTVTDKGDGTWAYAIDQAVTMDYAVQGEMTAKTTYGKVQVNGVFDEALGDTTAYKVAVSDISSEQTQTDPTLGQVTVKNTVDSLTFEGSAAAGAAGVDGVFTTTTTGIGYDIALPAREGVPAVQISGTVAEGSAEGSLTGYQPKAVYGLLAWFVAHPGEAMIEADKAGLKAQIEAALPLFGKAAVTGAYRQIVVNSPIGAFAMDEAAIAVEMKGVVADGLFREAISLKGLTLPEGLVPPFALPLIPKEVSVDVALSSFDLAAAAKLALGLLDLPAGAEPPEGFDMQVMMALMPQGAVDITLAPGVAKNDSYALTYEGAMRAGMGGAPTGTAKVTLAGIDAIMAALNAAPPEMSGQILPLLGMAQAMGQPGPSGELVWDIDASTPGSVKVNGMAMMGGQ